MEATRGEEVMAERTCSVYSQIIFSTKHCWRYSMSSSYLLLTPWVTTPSNPTPPQQYPPHPILCALGTPEIGKCQQFHPCMGCPAVQNPHPFKTFRLIPTALNVLSWCCPHLGITKSEKSRGVTSRFCSKDNKPEPLVQVIQPPGFLWSCPVSLFKDLQGIWVMFVWGYLLTGLSSSL